MTRSFRPSVNLLYKYILIFFIHLFTCSLISRAQTSTSHIPDSLLNIFQIQYPHSFIRSFKAGKDQDIIQFIQNKKKGTAVYDKNGHWKKTLVKVSQSKKLPGEVLQHFCKSAFSSWYIEQIEQYATPERKGFILKINNSNLLDGNHNDSFLESYHLDFDNDGNLLSQVRTR